MKTLSYRLVAEKLMNRFFSTPNNKEYHDILIYGLEITLSILMNMILVLTLAVVLGIGIETFVFCLFFMPLRFFAGGVHAKSHLACIGVFFLCELGSIYISKIGLSTDLQYIIISVLLVVSFLICIAYASKRKHTVESVKRIHRTLSLLLISMDLILITIAALTAV